MPEQNYLQVHYLHHLPLAGPLKLGVLTLWPWSTRRVQIGDSPAREYLDRLFSQMLDYRGLPLKHIAIVVPDHAAAFQPVPEPTVKTIRDSLAALFLCAAIENDAFGGAVSSENFYLVTQNFQPGSDGWATSDDKVVIFSAPPLRDPPSHGEFAPDRAIYQGRVAVPVPSERPKTSHQPPRKSLPRAPERGCPNAKNPLTRANRRRNGRASPAGRHRRGGRADTRRRAL